MTLRIVLGNIISLLSQVIDIAGTARYREKEQVLKVNMLATSIGLAVYFLLDSKSGIVSTIITLVRFVVIYYKDRHESKKWNIVFVAFFVTYFLMLTDTENPYSICLLANAQIAFISKWWCKDTQTIRLWCILACIIVIPYLYVVKNYVGIFFCVAEIVSFTIAFVAWRRSNRIKENL